MRQLHDQFAKECAAEMLEQLKGKVKVQHQLRGEVAYADLSFEPSPTVPTDVADQLGLFSKLVTKPCLMEFFSSQPTKNEIRSCVAKLFVYHGELLRKARRQQKRDPLANKRVAESALPHLWILTATASDAFLKSWRTQERRREWGEGIYFLGGPAQKTALVVLNRLPKTADTLWLRLLGRGETQKQAVAELNQQPAGPIRDYLLELIHQFYVELELKTTLTEPEKELFMNFSPAYIQSRQRAVQEGIQQGMQQGMQQGRVEGQRVVVEQLLKSRFGKLDKTLSKVLDGVIQLPSEEVAPLLLQASRDELVAKFNGKGARRK